jgi:protein TonB
MRSWILGLLAAVGVHLLILLFGGIFFLGSGEQKATTTVSDVDVLTADERDPDEKKDEKRKAEEELEKRKADEVDTAQDAPPDMRQLVALEEDMTALAAATPKLEALSLAALESAMGPAAGGEGDFGGAFSLASGGRIGGAAAAGGAEEVAKEDLVFSLSELDQQPRPVFQTAPVYPAELRQQKIEGTVYIVAVIDASGKVLQPKVERSTHVAFDAPALEAVRRWKFEPAVRSGQKVPAKLRLPIRFTMSG